MQTTIQKWGNSQGIRIPKAFLDALGMVENDTVDLKRVEDNIVITKVNRPKYTCLEDRLTSFYKKPIEEIYVDSDEEICTGAPVGGEIW